MVDDQDLFSGKWKFNPWQSKLSTPLPRIWVQSIVASREEIVVWETIVRGDGSQTEVRVWARFDEAEYPISGLPIADFMVYKRINSHNLSGMGKRNGVVVLNETLSVDPAGRVLTLIYSFQSGASQVARGMAVFDKEI
jgi:hypothetical protein